MRCRVRDASDFRCVIPWHSDAIVADLSWPSRLHKIHTTRGSFGVTLQRERGVLVPSNVDRYWEQYLASIPGGRQRGGRYRGGSAFGMTPDDAREISHLVRDCTKTATGSLLRSWEADGKPLPEAGDLWVVTSGPDEPVCVIETVEVRVIPYDEVPEQYAIDGGEGDRTLKTCAESTGNTSCTNADGSASNLTPKRHLPWSVSKWSIRSPSSGQLRTRNDWRQGLRTMIRRDRDRRPQTLSAVNTKWAQAEREAVRDCPRTDGP